MAYSTSNPPFLLFPNFDSSNPRVWGYKSADAAATVRVSGYITNGGALGMKVGDLVFVWDTATPLVTTHQVISVSTTSPGAVDLSDAVTVGSSTNTD